MKTAKCIVILRHGWRLAIRHWRETVGFSVLAWLCASAILTPLATWILHLLAVHDDAIISNYSIHLWLATPQGIACVILVGLIGTFSHILYPVGLFNILHEILTGHRLSAMGAIRHVLWRLPRLFKLSLAIFGISIPVALAVLSVPGLVHCLLLTEHDINFYLSTHPPEWLWTLLIDTLWIAGCLIILVRTVLRMSYVVPLWTEGAPLKQAVIASWNRTKGLTLDIFRMMVAVLSTWLIAHFILSALAFGLSGLALRVVTESIKGTIAVILAHGMVSIVMDAFLTMICASWAICVLLIIYRRRCGNSREFLAVRIPRHSNPRTVQTLPIKFSLAGVGLLVLLSWMGTIWLTSRQHQESMPHVIAHRAGAAHAPENSLAAMRKVLHEGVADIVEVDVTQTIDGELVLLHDKDLMRLAGDDRIVGESRYEDIQDVDIGATFSDAFRGEKIALLTDFLELAMGKTQIILEFKHGDDSNLVTRTIAAVRESGARDDIMIMSLELEEVRRVQELAPEIRVGYFASVEVGDVAALEVDVIGVKDGMATRAFIKDAHKQGTAVYAWTIDDARRMVELIEAGVDGIITNDPMLAREMVRRVGSLPLYSRTLLRFRRFWGVLRKRGWGARKVPHGPQPHAPSLSV